MHVQTYGIYMPERVCSCLFIFGTSWVQCLSSKLLEGDLDKMHQLHQYKV